MTYHSTFARGGELNYKENQRSRYSKPVCWTLSLKPCNAFLPKRQTPPIQPVGNIRELVKLVKMPYFLRKHSGNVPTKRGRLFAHRRVIEETRQAPLRLALIGGKTALRDSGLAGGGERDGA